MVNLYQNKYKMNEESVSKQKFWIFQGNNVFTAHFEAIMPVKNVDFFNVEKRLNVKMLIFGLRPPLPLRVKIYLLKMLIILHSSLSCLFIIGSGAQ